MMKSTVTPTIDLTAKGRHVGDLRVVWSDNSVPLGYHPVPIISLKGGPGPVFLMIGGTHGDEFEGPSALMRLANDLDSARLAGQIILLPALNAPALRAALRGSPLDGINLNRAFPGDPQGSISQQIAHYVETELLPRCDAAIDLHSGGKASVFAPCSLATHTEDPELFEKNLQLCHLFGLSLIWILGELNDPRSLNSAAERAGVPMIATELGGGGGVDPNLTNAAESGLYNILRHIGLLPGAVRQKQRTRRVQLASRDHSLYAPAEGLFDRLCQAGTDIKKGQEAGRLHFVDEPRRPSETLVFPADGFVLAHGNRGHIQRGDLLYLIAQDVE